MTPPVFALRLAAATLTVAFAAVLSGPPAGAAGEADHPGPVRLEPHHQVVLENAYVRLLDVKISPGHPTLYHVHSAATVFVQLNAAIGASQEPGQERSAPQALAAGFARFAAYDQAPLTHRAFAFGPNVSHILAVELLRPAPAVDRPAPPVRAGLQLAWAHRQVRLYRFRLGPGQTARVPADRCAHVLIAITGPLAAVAGPAPRRLELPAEAYAFFDPGTALLLQDQGRAASDGILLELP